MVLMTTVEKDIKSGSMAYTSVFHLSTVFMLLFSEGQGKEILIR